MTITDKQVEAACVAYHHGQEGWEILPRRIRLQERERIVAAIEAAEAARDAVATVAAWADGAPPHPWDKEWFVAELDNGDRAVLIALPEEYTYDFKTADQTYYMSSRLKRWMQFPDSEFVWLAERPTLTQPAAPSSAEQPVTPRIMIDGVDMTAQIRAAAIKDSSIPAPGAPEADDEDLDFLIRCAEAFERIASKRTQTSDHRLLVETRERAMTINDAATLAAMMAPGLRQLHDKLAYQPAARAQSGAAPSVAPFGYVDPSAKYSAAAFAFEPHGSKVAPVYLAPVSGLASSAKHNDMLAVAIGLLALHGQLGVIEYLRSLDPPAAPVSARDGEVAPAQFLANGARFKLRAARGMSRFDNFPPELAGRLVALVAAEDDQHLRPTPPADARDGEYTDEEVLLFLSVAMRHVDVKGELAFDDIRLGMKFVDKKRADRAMGGEA